MSKYSSHEGLLTLDVERFNMCTKYFKTFVFAQNCGSTLQVCRHHRGGEMLAKSSAWRDYSSWGGGRFTREE